MLKKGHIFAFAAALALTSATGVGAAEAPDRFSEAKTSVYWTECQVAFYHRCMAISGGDHGYCSNLTDMTPCAA